MGASGGRETLRRYGPGHFKAIGRRGFDAIVNKYFGGSREEAVTWLHQQAAERHIERLVSQKQEAEIAAGKTIVSEELPVLLSPEDDPYFWQERVRGRKDREIEF